MASTNEHIRFSASNRLKDVGEYYFSNKLRQISALNQAGKDIINLGIGSPDLPPHASVTEALNRAAQPSFPHGYQNYRGLPELRSAFARWYERYYNVRLNSENEILPLIGSKEGIMHICMSFLNHGDKVLIPNPGYPTYSSAVKIAGGDPVYYSLTNDGNIDIDQLSKFPTAKMIFVNYPHMPTGVLPPRDVFRRVIDFASKNHILVCHDNPYSFILNPERPRSIFEIEDAKKVAIELNSLSKSHNMAGWRIGMMAAAGHLIDEVIKFKSNMDSGMFYALQQAAIKALELGDEWFTALNNIYRKRREPVYQIASKLHLSLASKQQAGLFIWSSIPSDYEDAYHFSDIVLQKYRIFITPGGIFGSEGNRHIRISLCANEQLLNKALQRISL